MYVQSCVHVEDQRRRDSFVINMQFTQESPFEYVANMISLKTHIHTIYISHDARVHALEYVPNAKAVWYPRNSLWSELGLILGWTHFYTTATAWHGHKSNTSRDMFILNETWTC